MALAKSERKVLEQNQCLKVLNNTVFNKQNDKKITHENYEEFRTELLSNDNAYNLQGDEAHAILIALCKYFPKNPDTVASHNVFLTASGTQYDLRERLSPEQLTALPELDKKNYSSLHKRRNNIKTAGGFLGFTLGAFSGMGVVSGLRQLIAEDSERIGIGYAVILAVSALVIAAFISYLAAHFGPQIMQKCGSTWQRDSYNETDKLLLTKIEDAIDAQTPKNVFQRCYANMFSACKKAAPENEYYDDEFHPDSP